jgi:hypothetical protein
MTNFVLGVLTASLAPLAMTFGFILWEESWRSTPFALNIFKCTVASVVFQIVIWSLQLSTTATSTDQAMIMLSSFLGIVIGDNAWLAALQ